MNADRTPESILRLLDETISLLQQSIASLADADDERFTRGSINLIRLERDKLDSALRFGDPERTNYALRSVLGLTKGVLDIGASWTFGTSYAKQQFDEAMARARGIVYSA